MASSSMKTPTAQLADTGTDLHAPDAETKEATSTSRVHPGGGVAIMKQQFRPCHGEPALKWGSDIRCSRIICLPVALKMSLNHANSPVFAVAWGLTVTKSDSSCALNDLHMQTQSRCSKSDSLPKHRSSSLDPNSTGEYNQLQNAASSSSLHYALSRASVTT